MKSYSFLSYVLAASAWGVSTLGWASPVDAEMSALLKKWMAERGEKAFVESAWKRATSERVAAPRTELNMEEMSLRGAEKAPVAEAAEAAGKSLSLEELMGLVAPKIETAAARALESFKRAAGSKIPGVRALNKAERIEQVASDWFTVEVGVYEQHPSHSAELNSLIEEVIKDGGQVRYMVGVKRQTGQILEVGALGMFYREAYRPRVVINGSVELPALVHERQHYHDWKGLIHQLRAQGIEYQKSFEMAEEIFQKHEFVVFTEKRAIEKELKASKKVSEKLGVSLAEQVQRFENAGFVPKVTYPENEGLLRVLALTPDQVEQGKPYIQQMVRVALKAHRARYRQLKLTEAARFNPNQLFEEAMGSSVLRWKTFNVWEQCKKMFFEALPLEIAKLPADDFRHEVEKHLSALR